MKYFVDKERGIVKAAIDNCENDIYNFYMKRVKVNDLFNPVVLKNLLKLKKKYVGVAKCSPNDVFNEELGRLIAARRASEKYERDRLKIFTKFVEIAGVPMSFVLDEQDKRTTLAEVRSRDTENIVDIYENLLS